MTVTPPVSTEMLDKLMAPVSSAAPVIKRCTCAPGTTASTELLDSLISPATLSERLGTTERNLSEWRIKGRGPKYIRVGRSVRYIPEHVDSWLLAHEHLSTSEEVR